MMLMSLLDYEWMLRDMVFACGDKCLLRLGHSPTGATTASITESESDDAHRFLKATSLHLIFKKSNKSVAKITRISFMAPSIHNKSLVVRYLLHLEDASDFSALKRSKRHHSMVI